jgi:hypothetical protein
MNDCDHRFVRDGEVVTSPMRECRNYWARYFCERCLKYQFVLTKTVSDYTGVTEHKDGSEVVDSVKNR